MSHRTGRGKATQADFAMFEGGCRGKMRFTSKRLAVGKLRVMRDRLGNDGYHMSAYKCSPNGCGFWHFGHTPKHLRES